MFKIASTILLLITILHLHPAHAEENIPLRTDSGLIKTEQLLASGNFTAAINSADNVIKRHKNNADAFAYKAYAYYKLGEKENALRNFKYALKAYPNHLGANKYLASIYIDGGHIAQALEQLQVIRMICGNSNCIEIEMIEREIDNHKKNKK